MEGHVPRKKSQKKRLHDGQKRGEPQEKHLKNSNGHQLLSNEVIAPSTSTFSPVASADTLKENNPKLGMTEERQDELKYYTPNTDKRESVFKQIINKWRSSILSFIDTYESLSLSINSVKIQQGKSYVEVMGHFYEKSIKRVSLGIIEVSENIPSECLIPDFGKICEKWEIPISQVTAVVSNSNDTVNEAIRSIFGKEKLLYCYAEMVNRISWKIGSERVVRETFKKVNMHLIADGCISGITHNLTDGEDISFVVPSTRTQYEYLQKYFELHLKKRGLFCLSNILNRSELIIAKDVRNSLEIWNLLIEELDGIRKKEYASEIIPIFSVLKKALFSFSPLSPEGNDLKCKLEKVINEIFQPIVHVQQLGMSTLLDPRFKGSYIPDNMADSLSVNYFIKSLNNGGRGPALKNLHGVSCNLTPDIHVCEFAWYLDLQRFLDEPISLKKTTDPVQYWINNSAQFPHLWKTAITYLCIPVSVSERNISLKDGMFYEMEGGKARLEKELLINSISGSNC